MVLLVSEKGKTFRKKKSPPVLPISELPHRLPWRDVGVGLMTSLSQVPNFWHVKNSPSSIYVNTECTSTQPICHSRTISQDNRLENHPWVSANLSFQRKNLQLEISADYSKNIQKCHSLQVFCIHKPQRQAKTWVKQLHIVTPLKIIMSPEKGPFQKEAGSSSNHHFWGANC